MSRAAASASPAPAVPRAWADVVARYLEALRLTHYAADTVHIRTLYLKYFTAWATARGLTKPKTSPPPKIPPPGGPPRPPQGTRGRHSRCPGALSALALSLPQADRHATERVEPA